LSGGGEEIAPPDAIVRFRELAGGPNATIVFIPTASSGLRLSTGEILEVPPAGALGADAAPFATALARLFGVRRVVILHTRDRSEADSPEFVRPLLAARAAWISSGNAGRLIDSYLDTRTMRALAGILERDGVIGGNSAGAIIQGSYTVRGRADKPVLMARGRERGFAFLPEVAINPHVVAAHREDELVTVIDWHPQLLGLGIDTGAAAIVRNGALMPLGTGRIAVYDNVRRDGRWYYWMRPNTCLVLRTRQASEEACRTQANTSSSRESIMRHERASATGS
jgi:cyanophycinase-like exopeptidase